MKKFTFFLANLIGLLILTSLVNAQTFSNQFKNGSDQLTLTAASLVDGNTHLLFAGYSTSNTGTNNGAFIAKTDLSGNLIWSKLYSPDRTDWILVPGCFIQVGSEYFIIGYIDRTHDAAMLMKIDENGNFISMRRIQPDENHLPCIQPRQAVLTSDNYLLITGTGGDGDEKSGLLWMKTDTSFIHYEIKEAEPRVKNIVGIKIFALSNDSSMIACTTGNTNFVYSNQHTEYPTFVKLDSAGNTVVWKNYRMLYPGNLNDCIRLSDGSFVFIGSGLDHSFIGKINAAMQVQWLKTYAINNTVGYHIVWNTYVSTFRSIAPIAGGYLIGGEKVAVFPAYSSVLMQTDLNGVSVSYDTVHTVGVEGDTKYIFAPSPSNYVAVGETSPLGSAPEVGVNLYSTSANLLGSCSETVFPISSADGSYLEKDKSFSTGPSGATFQAYTDDLLDVSSYGSISPICGSGREEEMETVDGVSLSPNPAVTSLNLHLSSDLINAHSQIYIYSSVGQLVYSNASFSTQLVSIPVANWQKGIYFLTIRSNDGTSRSLSFSVQ